MGLLVLIFALLMSVLVFGPIAIIWVALLMVGVMIAAGLGAFLLRGAATFLGLLLLAPWLLLKGAVLAVRAAIGLPGAMSDFVREERWKNVGTSFDLREEIDLMRWSARNFVHEWRTALLAFRLRMLERIHSWF